MGQSISNEAELFNELPPELRLMIWEEAVPKKKDTHAAYKIFRSSFLRGLRWKKPDGAGGPRPLLEACSEARAVAMKSGSYMTVKNEKYRFSGKRLRGLSKNKYYSVWVDNSFTTLHVPFAALTCGRITNLPSNIQAIASTVPTERGLEALQRCLTQDPQYKGIKTVYLGIVGIPIHYSKGDAPDYYPCTESESAVVPLHDEKLITYLESAYKAHASMTIGDSMLRGELFYHKSAMRFKHSLERDWKNYQNLRSKWDPENGIRLLPAVIFGNKQRKVVTWSDRLFEIFVYKIRLSNREAQSDLAWMDAFAYDNGAGNENKLNELPYQWRLRRFVHREKDMIRDLFYSPHDAEGEKRWNVPS
ncbi:hypothetical protein FGADI_1205 [Fusarium gaditjirri]|uniref:2EXR domain-containing protein n=1 Tax=Fusarium gaditjirri TaxID=282569 RepID=A0A8H4X3L7_9HYPO|nr:hypothetical protein FGADI_1205 [Fusarium gaditjirri]